jgi:hypothetical protein
MVGKISSNTCANQLLNAAPLDLPGRTETQRWTFAAGSTGAIGAHTLASVTGLVAVRVVARVVSDLTSAGAPTAEVGITGSTPTLLAQVADATGMDSGEIWHDATVDAKIELLTVLGTKHLTTQNIILTIGTATITGGSMDFTILWSPISEDGNLEISTPA